MQLNELFFDPYRKFFNQFKSESDQKFIPEV